MIHGCWASEASVELGWVNFIQGLGIGITLHSGQPAPIMLSLAAAGGTCVKRTGRRRRVPPPPQRPLSERGDDDEAAGGGGGVRLGGERLAGVGDGGRRMTTVVSMAVAGRVVRSRDASFSVGDEVKGFLPWRRSNVAASAAAAAAALAAAGAARVDLRPRPDSASHPRRQHV